MLRRFCLKPIRSRILLWWRPSRLPSCVFQAARLPLHPMKTPILILLSALALAVTSIAFAQHEHDSAKQLYTCPMHPEIVRAEPGQCPKCGMTLVPVKEERKHPTLNAQHPTSNPEHATHDANGMAMAEHD